MSTIRSTFHVPLRIRLFCHSIISDWNNGHAHFLRGVVTDLSERGHDVRVFEPFDSWSFTSLVREQGIGAIAQFHERFPAINVRRYETLDLAEAVAGADLVIAHEWNAPPLIEELGALRLAGMRFQLLFHDTHHRAVTDPAAMEQFNLRHFDGVLAFGDVLRDIYRSRGWATQAWTWHEAADARAFYPRPGIEKDLDLVWIGNWGDDERSAELMEFLIHPVRRLGLHAKVFGVRYPAEALATLEEAGIAYGGWLPNAEVAAVFARARVTVHVPRRPYAQQLPGIPTIRPFEAMACGIPLVSGPWNDSEHLFSPGVDFLAACDGDEMTRHLDAVLTNSELATGLVGNALNTILRRHTCTDRVDRLLGIYERLVTSSQLSS